MQIQIGQNVSYEVDKVVVPMIVIHSGANKELNVNVPYEWRDTQGKILRTGHNNYTETQLIAAFAAQGQDFVPVGTVLKSLLPSMGHVGIHLNDDGTIDSESLGVGLKPDGKHGWVVTKKDATQFAAAISPLTCDQLKAMVVAFTQMIFA
jgi:hypothetical protein